MLVLWALPLCHCPACANARATTVPPRHSLFPHTTNDPLNNSAEARAASADAPAAYLALVRQLLGLGLSALGETPARLAAARARLSQADKLQLLASASKDAAARAAAQREEGERQLGEAMRAAEAVVAQCAEALDGARARVSALARSAPERAAALAPAARELEELMAHARAQLDGATIAAAGGAVAAAPAAPVAPAFVAPVAAAPTPVAAAPRPAPAAASAPVANGGPKQAPAAAAPAPAAPAPRPQPPRAEEAPADGFQTVASKKGRRPRA